MFFYVLSFFYSFLFFIRNTRDRSDRVHFFFLVTQISELSQTYAYPLLMVSALIRFFKYEISINSKDNISKILIETQQSNTVSDFARLFQTYQIAVFFIERNASFSEKSHSLC